MAGKRIETKRLVGAFIAELQKNISVSKIILFGSRRKNRAAKWSDIDLAVISDDFKGMSPFRRLVLLGKIAWKAGATPIEALGYTPYEYIHASSLDFISEIKKNGKILYSA